MKGEGKELAELALFFTAGTAAGLAADSHLINVLIPISFTAAAVLALCPVISIRSGDREYRFGSGWTPFLLKMSFFFAGLLTASVHSVDGGCIQAWNIFRPLQNAALDSVRGLKSLIDGIPFNDRDSNAMITALITGDKSGLPAHVGESFRISGASHILALSGMHLGVIYVILARTFSTFGNSPRAVLLRSSLVVAVSGYYTMMTGAGASIVRAFLFITLNEAARCTGRKRTPANVFCTSLMIQAALSPEVLESAGFQLSYLAMAGIYVLYPKMRSWYRETEPSGNSLSRRMTRYFSPKRLWDTAAMSISCQIFTAPAVWYHFGTFPPYFLISNLIAIPLSSLIINLSIPVIILEAAGICPEFLIRADEAAIKALCGSLEIVSGL